QALEGLRARHFMDEVTVDIDQAGSVVLAVDDVVVEDLVVERFRRCGSGVHLKSRSFAGVRGADEGRAAGRAAGSERTKARGHGRGEAPEEPGGQPRMVGDPGELQGGAGENHGSVYSNSGLRRQTAGPMQKGAAG